MKAGFLKNLILIAIIGLCWWFFGNLYEAIVISPNWVVNSPEQMQRLHEFFVNTNPTIYFVPITIVANLLVWVITVFNRSDMIRSDLRRASIFAVALAALNVIIVTTIVSKLFSPDFASYGNDLSLLTQRWNILNAFRMVLTACTIVFLFRGYSKLLKN